MDWGSLISLFGILILGYFLGSLPFGLLITRIGGVEDIRSIGSGNIGATNVLRTGNKYMAAATLVADVLKGTIAVFVGNLLLPDGGLVAGLGAFIGHLHPIWLKFKGGKGVATFIGVLGAVFWPSALIFCLIWLVFAIIFRYSSLSSLTATTFAPVSLYAFGQTLAAILFLFMAILVFISHRENIVRLLAGKENKIGSKKF